MLDLYINMRISYNHINYTASSVKIKNTRNPIELYRMMKIYSKERKENLPIIRAILNSLDTILSNGKMRLVKDNTGKILAAYTYNLRRNRRDEKSMHIDALVRNRKNPKSKEIMPDIYEDMKQIANNQKAKELTLFNYLKDKKLRANYSKLGFKIDESVKIPQAFVMRVRINEFLATKII